MLTEVSVVMSVYNGEEYLREAIDSILSQTYSKFEFIIIDDGSTDNSKKIIKSYTDSRIILLEQSNSGVAVALNNAINISRNQFIARMDADDIAFSERLETQLSFLKENPDYVLVGSNARVIDNTGEFVYNSDLPLEWEEILLKFPESSFYHSSVMFRRSTFNQVGGYFEEISKFNCFEDSLLWNKMKNYGRMANINKPLICYRLTGSAATSKSGKDATTLRTIFKEIAINDKISDINYKLLRKIKLSRDKNDQQFNYYIHLTKKFLLNNYSPGKARNKLRAAFEIKPYNLTVYFWLLVSFFPRRFVSLIHKISKKNR